MVQSEDCWGEACLVTVPCATHAPRVAQLQTLWRQVRHVEAHLACLRQWVDGVCRDNPDSYDAEDYTDWSRSVQAECARLCALLGKEPCE